MFGALSFEDFSTARGAGERGRNLPSVEQGDENHAEV